VRAFSGVVESVAESAIAGWRAGEVVQILPFAQQLTLEMILQSLLGASEPAIRDRVRSISTRW
jgi:cytochrome P450